MNLSRMITAAGTTEMRVLRVEVEAPACSFRYPHFLVGRQLTFDMPPPSTILGHIASAVGQWPDPTTLRFAYWFTARGKGEDLENQELVVPAAAGRSGTGRKAHAKALVATVQPTRREFLLGVRLILYLNRLDLASAFLAPTFPVVLGRSQDLASYIRVEEITLTRSDRGYFEATILPLEFRRRTARGVTVLMPRYVSPPPLREAAFDRYIVLQDRLYCGARGDGDRFGSRDMLRFEGENVELLIDPDSPEWAGAHRALAFHGFVDGDAPDVDT